MVLVERNLLSTKARRQSSQHFIRDLVQSSTCSPPICAEDLTSSKPQANHICVYFSFSLFFFCFISQPLRSSQEGGLGAGLLSKTQPRLSSRFEVFSPSDVSLGSIEGTTVSSPNATVAAAFFMVDSEAVRREDMMSIVAERNDFFQLTYYSCEISFALDGACVRRFLRHRDIPC